MQRTSATSVRAQPDVRKGNDGDGPTREGSNPVVLGSSLVMNGDLELAEEADLVIVGRVVAASISGVRNLYVGPDGHLCGSVRSVTAEIAGTVEGRLDASDTVVVRRSATLRAEVSARTLRIESGTALEGSVLSGQILRS